MNGFDKKYRYLLTSCLVLVLAAILATAWAPRRVGSGYADGVTASQKAETSAQSNTPAVGTQTTGVVERGSTSTTDELYAGPTGTTPEVPAAGYVIDTAEDDANEQAQPASTQEAPYKPDTVLLSVADGATLEEVNELIAQTASVQPREVYADELVSGVIELTVAEGSSVEDAMGDLEASAVSEHAQPDFIYYALLGDESALRERLAETLEPQTGEADLPEGVTSEQDEDVEVSAEDEATVADTQLPEGSTGEGSEEDPIPVEADSTSEPTDDALVADSDVVNDPEDESNTSGMQALADQLVPNDAYTDQQWALSSIKAYEAWAQVTCDGKVGIAIMDEGPDATHEDLVANVRDSYDIYAESATSSLTLEHGTHVSGIVGAVANNEIGVAGVSHNAALMLLNVFYEHSSGTKYVTNTSTLIRAYRYVTDHQDALNVRVVNLSLGVKKDSNSAYSDDALVKCINDAFSKGIVTVAAAGNSELGTVPYYEYPGDAPNVVSVMNLKRTSTGEVRSSTSNYNVDGQTSKNISAPGNSIVSTAPVNSYVTSSGTSMAAPHVSGVLALEFAANPSLTAQEAVDILYATARDLGDEGWDVEYGWGEVDASAAVKAAKAGEHPELPDISDHETPEPKVVGPTRMPVGSKATFQVTDGSLQIKSGGSAAKLSGTTLTGVSAGMVTLSVLDKTGEERATRNVVVYASTGTWVLQPSGSDSHVLDVKGGSVQNSANVQIYTSNGKNNQVWLLEAQKDGSFVVRSGKSGKVLDVSGGSTKSGANVILYAASGKAWQRWKMTVNADNTVTLTNVNSSMALELAGDPANSRNVRQGSPTGKKAQKWALRSVTADLGPIWDGVYKVASSINKSYVLDVKRASTDNGGNVQLYKANDKDNQRWRFEYLGNDVYRIVNVNSGKALDVARGTLKNSVNIDQWSWNGGKNQRWELVSYKDGSYVILRAGTSWAVDVKGAKAENGRNVHQYQRKNNAAQRWYLTQY